jgi:multisubunit Na+/H+ antiporter MnhG subunit
VSSSWIEPAHPTRRELTRFGGTIALVLVIAAVVRRHSAGDTLGVNILIAGAALFALACVVAPQPMSVVYRWWMHLAEALAWVNTRVLLIIIFYLVVTPVGLVMRLARRAPLDTAKKDSYWTEPPRSSYGDKHYEKQF